MSATGRDIDRARPVQVYRNLNRGCLSIRQDGLVVAHTDSVTLLDVVFRVQQAGRRRAVRDGQRNVHAYAQGTIAGRPVSDGILVTYDPFGAGRFETAEGEPVERCERLTITVAQGRATMRAEGLAGSVLVDLDGVAVVAGQVVPSAERLGDLRPRDLQPVDEVAEVGAGGMLHHPAVQGGGIG